MQARRTGTASVLGELFDHGCDAITTVLVAVALACTLQVRLRCDFCRYKIHSWMHGLR